MTMMMVVCLVDVCGQRLVPMLLSLRQPARSRAESRGEGRRGEGILSLSHVIPCHSGHQQTTTCPEQSMSSYDTITSPIETDILSWTFPLPSRHLLPLPTTTSMYELQR